MSDTKLENQKTDVLLSKIIVNKLEILASDIKIYVNSNSKSLENEKTFNIDDLQELLQIRLQIKKLHYKLSEQLNS